MGKPRFAHGVHRHLTDPGGITDKESGEEPPLFGASGQLSDYVSSDGDASTEVETGGDGDRFRRVDPDYLAWPSAHSADLAGDLTLDRERLPAPADVFVDVGKDPDTAERAESPHPIHPGFWIGSEEKIA